MAELPIPLERAARAAVAVVGAPTIPLFGAAAALRRARVFHPVGVALTGTWTAADDTVRLLSPSRPWPVIVRISKGAGTPGRTPDVLGVAIRLAELHGHGRHQDLLFASSREEG